MFNAEEWAGFGQFQLLAHPAQVSCRLVARSWTIHTTPIFLF